MILKSRRPYILSNYFYHSLSCAASSLLYSEHVADSYKGCDFTPCFISIAGFIDETPRDYHCNLGPDGRRRDADERPELCRGTVEFVASKEYMVS